MCVCGDSYKTQICAGGASQKSLGIIYYQMLFGRYPYEGKNDMQIINMIKTKPLELESNVAKISDNSKDLLRKIIVMDPKERISFQGIVEHPLFANVPQIQKIKAKMQYKIETSPPQSKPVSHSNNSPEGKGSV